MNGSLDAEAEHGRFARRVGEPRVFGLAAAWSVPLKGHKPVGAREIT